MQLSGIIHGHGRVACAGQWG